MKGKKIAGIILVVVGIIITIVSLLADLTGIGHGTFGTKQIIGAVVGVIIAGAGVFLMAKK